MPRGAARSVRSAVFPENLDNEPYQGIERISARHSLHLALHQLKGAIFDGVGPWEGTGHPVLPKLERPVLDPNCPRRPDTMRER
jgi:hypothetical protein